MLECVVNYSNFETLQRPSKYFLSSFFSIPSNIENDLFLFSLSIWNDIKCPIDRSIVRSYIIRFLYFMCHNKRQSIVMSARKKDIYLLNANGNFFLTFSSACIILLVLWPLSFRLPNRSVHFATKKKTFVQICWFVWNCLLFFTNMHIIDVTSDFLPISNKNHPDLQ